MNSFKEFNIKVTARGFEGDKVRIQKILDREIVVHQYKIEDSKVFKDRGTGKCLHMQIEFNNEKHIVFTGSSGLIEVIQQIPEGGFPFTTTIKRENDRFKFT